MAQTHRLDRQRRSAKTVLEDMTNEILRRPDCEENRVKLDLLETVAGRMGWNDLFNRIKFRNRGIQKAHWYQD